MLTPAFDLSQDPDYLTIVIKVPYARVSEFDVYFEGDQFKFYAKPYFLRLTLPGRIVEDGREKCSYNVDEGIFTVTLPKETPGQHFEGLGMLTALLATKGSRSAKPLVEEIDTPAEPEEEEEEEDDFDWQVEQTPYVEECVTLNSQCYGFGNLRSGVFSRLQDELSDVIDLKSPDETPADERLPAQLAAEDAKFDPDHYLADLFEDEAILPMLKYKMWLADAIKNSTSVGGCSLEQDSQEVLFVSFSEDEKKQLRNFKYKSVLLDKQARRQAYLSLVDILLAYCYDVRVSEGENNVESAWNIRKLSGTLSWLQSYSSVHGVMVSFGRRVLCYPLYRHFKLVMNVVKDCSLLLQTGKAAVLKCLLHIHRIFQENDPAYILNDLYITDYCIWVQQVRSKKLTALAYSLQTTTLTKAELGFELEELEFAARLVQEEEKEVTSLPDFHQLRASSQVGTSDTEESSSSSKDSESDSSSDSSSETEDTDSDSSSESGEAKSGEEKISASKDLKICLKKGLQNKRTAPLVEELELIQPTETATELACIRKADHSSQSDHGQEKLVEELGENLRITVVLSESSEDLTTEFSEVVMDNSTQGAQELEVKGSNNGQQNKSLKSTSVSVDLVEKHCGALVTEMCRSLQDIDTHCAPTPAQKPHVGKSEQSLPVEELAEQLSRKVVLSD